jgi:hypothetical protein
MTDTIELEQLVDLLDSALNSSDHRVVSALRQLLMIVALTDTGNVSGGPLRDLLGRQVNNDQQLKKLDARVHQLETRIERLVLKTLADSSRCNNVWTDHQNINC